MMTKDELDEQFFHHDAVVPSITVFSYEPAPPEDMGFFAPGNKELESRDGRKEEVEKATEEITATPPEKEVEDKKEEARRRPQAQWMYIDKVLVNGVEVTKCSTL